MPTTIVNISNDTINNTISSYDKNITTTTNTNKNNANTINSNMNNDNKQHNITAIKPPSPCFTFFFASAAQLASTSIPKLHGLDRLAAAGSSASGSAGPASGKKGNKFFKTLGFGASKQEPQNDFTHMRLALPAHCVRSCGHAFFRPEFCFNEEATCF